MRRRLQSQQQHGGFQLSLRQRLRFKRLRRYTPRAPKIRHGLFGTIANFPEVLPARRSSVAKTEFAVEWVERIDTLATHVCTSMQSGLVVQAGGKYRAS